MFQPICFKAFNQVLTLFGVALIQCMPIIFKVDLELTGLSGKDLH